MADLLTVLLVALKLCVFGLFVLIIAFTLYIHYMHLKLKHIAGPPRENFYLGNLLAIRRRRLNEGKNIHQTLADWSLHYRPIFVIWFFHVPLTVISDADVVREVLVVKNLPKDYFGYKRFQYVYGERFLGYGLFSDLNIKTWEIKRRTFAPMFYRNKLFDSFHILNACCEKFLKKLEKYADGTTVISLADEFLLVTLETILKWACDLQLKDDDWNLFEKNFKNALKGISLSFTSPQSQFTPWSSLRRECEQGARITRAVVKQVVEKREKEMRNGCDTRDDLLSYVFKLEDALPECDIEDLVDMVVTIVFGGMDTTGNSLCFTALSIGLHADVENKLRKEIDEVIGDLKEITAKDIMAMPYLGQVVKESLRLHPPTPAITRRTNYETFIGNVKIPGDVPVMANPYVIQTHPDYWKDPHSFNPDRFADPELVHPAAYFPFSLGPRRCIAPQHAELQLKLIIARLLKKFKFKLLPGQTLKVAENISFGPVGTVRCTLTLANES